MYEKEKFPVIIKNTLPIKQKRTIYRIKNGLKRFGKIALNFGIATTGLVLLELASPIIAGLGAGIFLVSGTNAVYNIVLKKEDKLMFVTRKNLKGELMISQDSLNVTEMSKMVGMEPYEKGALMGVHTLIGLQRYKQQFKDQNKKNEKARDGENNVYFQKFKTITHGINIKTIEALEKLGYIQIERNEPKMKSLLISEKIGFKQYKEAKDAVIAKITNNQEEILKHQKQMREIIFRLTDKTFDFEQIYKDYKQVLPTKEKNLRRKPLRRIGVILEALKDTNIDIRNNDVGLPELYYNSQESFTKRMDKEIEQSREQEDFKNSLRIKKILLEQKQFNKEDTSIIQSQEREGEER